MRTYTLHVTLEPIDGGRFLATTDDLQGCLAEGDTIEEALEYLVGNAEVILEVAREHRAFLPEELDGDFPVAFKAVVVNHVGA